MRRVGDNLKGLAIPALFAALFAAPLFSLAAISMGAGKESYANLSHLSGTVLSSYLGNSLALLVIVGALTFITGLGTAWLTAVYKYPGSWFLNIALLLPLAVPPYVSATAYAWLFDYEGPLQSSMRARFGWGKEDYWFPEIRSLPGAALVLSASLYPYVFLACRIAIVKSIPALNVARTLGCPPRRFLFEGQIPLIRPAIFAGLALVGMETLADFGTLQYLAVDGFTTGIYKTWLGLNDIASAGILSLALLSLVLVLVALEKLSRGGARFDFLENLPKKPSRIKLKGLKALGCWAICLIPPAIGFALPVTVLFHLAGEKGAGTAPLWSYAANSLLIAAGAALLMVGLAFLLKISVRLSDSRAGSFLASLSSLGYAVPGSVLAVGILALSGFSGGALFSGSIAALLYAYSARFLALPAGSLESALSRIPPAFDAVARTMGRGKASVSLAVLLPLLKPSLLAGFLLAFVEVVKELPATLIIRPFNFETLATQAFILASDERLAASAPLSLSIIALGVLPVLLLGRAFGRG